jgi:chromosome segregation ATPase
MIKELSEKMVNVEVRLEDHTRILRGLNVGELEAKIKQIFDRFSEFAFRNDVETLKEDAKELKAVTAQHKEVIDQMIQNITTNKEDIMKTKGKTDLLESKLSHITKTIMELSAKIDKCMNAQKSDDGLKIVDGDWNAIKNAINLLRKDLTDVQKEIGEVKNHMKKIGYLERMMDAKLDKEEFEKWKASQDLNQIMAALVKKFADRNEMLKALRQLEKRILMLEDMLAKGPGETCENAMLIKKPLGGWSCASCEKDLVNLETFKAPYMSWAKMPKRDAMERIAKVRIREC